MAAPVTTPERAAAPAATVDARAGTATVGLSHGDATPHAVWVAPLCSAALDSEEPLRTAFAPWGEVAGWRLLTTNGAAFVYLRSAEACRALLAHVHANNRPPSVLGRQLVVRAAIVSQDGTALLPGTPTTALHPGIAATVGGGATAGGAATPIVAHASSLYAGALNRSASSESAPTGFATGFGSAVNRAHSQPTPTPSPSSTAKPTPIPMLMPMPSTSLFANPNSKPADYRQALNPSAPPAAYPTLAGAAAGTSPLATAPPAHLAHLLSPTHMLSAARTTTSGATLQGLGLPGVGGFGLPGAAPSTGLAAGPTLDASRPWSSAAAAGGSMGGSAVGGGGSGSHGLWAGCWQGLATSTSTWQPSMQPPLGTVPSSLATPPLPSIGPSPALGAGTPQATWGAGSGLNWSPLSTAAVFPAQLAAALPAANLPPPADGASELTSGSGGGSSLLASALNPLLQSSMLGVPSRVPSRPTPCGFDDDGMRQRAAGWGAS